MRGLHDQHLQVMQWLMGTTLRKKKETQTILVIWMRINSEVLGEQITPQAELDEDGGADENEDIY